MKPDAYGRSTVCSIYFDTPDRRLVRTSLEKPVYKEKLRLRTYGVPKPDSPAFVELKKKYKGVVYKRRIMLPYAEAFRWLCGGEAPEKDSQIQSEIAWFLQFYGDLEPAAALCCDRDALYGREDDSLRVTFDEAIRWRVEDVDLLHGDGGAQLLPDGVRLMEIKAVGGMPGWLADALGELHIYPKIARFAAVLLTLLLAGCSSVQPAAQTDASPAPSEKGVKAQTYLEITGGTLTINGGTICVSGPTDSANGTFDSGTGFTVNGGVLLGAGSAGMMETPGGDSAQNVVIVSGSGQAGSMVEIRDAAGSVLVSWTVPKSFSVVTFSMPEITVGETYAVYVDGTQAASAECTGVVTGGAGGMAGGFDRGGGKGGFMDPGAQKPGGMPEKPSAAGGLFGVGQAQ